MELTIKEISEHYYVKIGCQEFIFDDTEQMKKTACKLIDEQVKTGKIFRPQLPTINQPEDLAASYGGSIKEFICSSGEKPQGTRERTIHDQEMQNIKEKVFND